MILRIRLKELRDCMDGWVDDDTSLDEWHLWHIR